MTVILALLKRFWPYIATGGVILGLSIALLVTRETLHDRSRELAMAELKLATSNASIDSLEAELKRIAEDQRKLATNDAARILQSRQQLALVDAATKARQSVIDRLLTSAEVERKPDGDEECQFSEAVLSAWPS